MTRPVRIGNASGFYGDRLTAMRTLVDGGDIDVITGDYLAELTMLILWKARQKNPETGYARTFLTQFADVVGDCARRGIKVVVNAGGLDPAGLADKVRTIIADAGVELSVAHVDGDDLIPQLAALQADGTSFEHQKDCLQGFHWNGGGKALGRWRPRPDGHWSHHQQDMRDL